MKLRNTCKQQSGFFAVGLGLALTAVLGLTAATLPSGDYDESVVDQPVQQVPNMAYQDSDK